MSFLISADALFNTNFTNETNWEKTLNIGLNPIHLLAGGYMIKFISKEDIFSGGRDGYCLFDKKKSWDNPFVAIVNLVMMGVTVPALPVAILLKTKTLLDPKAKERLDRYIKVVTHELSPQVKEVSILENHDILSKLPRELRLSILKLLTNRDLSTFGKTSRGWYHESEQVIFTNSLPENIRTETFFHLAKIKIRAHCAGVDRCGKKLIQAYQSLKTSHCVDFLTPHELGTHKVVWFKDPWGRIGIAFCDNTSVKVYERINDIWETQGISCTDKDWNLVEESLKQLIHS